MVRVRWLLLGAARTPDLARWRGMLDTEELSRASRFRLATDRDSFIAAHALARAMLSAAAARATDSWIYQPGEFGKPAIAGEQKGLGLHFSISHTRGCAACAIAFHEVGVDVEAADRPIDIGVSRRFLTADEHALVLRAPIPERAAAFFAIWTLKEAFIKATGEGLRRPLTSFSIALNPPRINFHPSAMAPPCTDDPANWELAQFYATARFPLAVAIRCAAERALRLDARAAAPHEIKPS
jgi:4'-phosphopantetheinyl transferase